MALLRSIGLAMDWHGSEGLVYVIVGAAVLYFGTPDSVSG